MFIKRNISFFPSMNNSMTFMTNDSIFNTQKNLPKLIL